MPKLKDNCNLPIHKKLAFFVWGHSLTDQPVIFLKLAFTGLPFTNRKKLEDGNDKCDRGSHRANTDA
jgi:hypothetical protein